MTCHTHTFTSCIKVTFDYQHFFICGIQPRQYSYNIPMNILSANTRIESKVSYQ